MPPDNNCLFMPNVKSFGTGVIIESQMVFLPILLGVGVPSASDLKVSSKPSGSTAKTSVSEDKLLATIAVEAVNPPPPQGTKILSILSSNSSNTSSAAVPEPAKTSGWALGGTSILPV